VGLVGWGISPSQGRYLTHRKTQTQNKLTQTLTLQVEFEPTIPAFDRAKAVHALQGNGPIRHVETCPDFFSLQEYTQQNTLSKF
jgi:hypothetical protein